MNTDCFPPLLALARDWKAGDAGLVWREAAWCHALLLGGHYRAAVARLAATVRVRTGVPVPFVPPALTRTEAEAITVALLHRLRAAG